MGNTRVVTGTTRPSLREVELRKTISHALQYSAACSRNIVLKQCLGLPTPLWREVMNLMGGEHSSIANQVYGEFD